MPPAARGASGNPPNRFEALAVELDEPAERNPRTQFLRETSGSIISRNDSPDISFGASLNPYRGCEHGCSYCYARPYHEYLGFSSGLDFETRIIVKTNAPKLLREMLSSPKWVPEVLGMSGVTDCYQPIEKRLELTRACLEVLAEFRNPVGVITKNHLVTRDIDLLTELSRHHACAVHISLTTLDPNVSRRMEPRAALPDHRLDAIQRLADAGIPTGVVLAPLVPGLTDHEIPALLKAARAAGARRAAYSIIRLPHAVKEIFSSWLEENFPGSREKVLSRIRDLRGGRLHSSTFGERLRGTGIWAEQIRAMFVAARDREGFDPTPFAYSTSAFRRPPPAQMELF
ncbi:MAG: PA0069 family radical SAM protein [Terrimicrobiaceae bacterium]|nr:PA0069 family radical SAM protein [Terrimicrobiaceae bacterium]